MATKAERDLEEELGPSPDPLFADREEPWKDLELMLKLDQQHDYQYEIAHVLGTSESKISYWMQKAHDDPEVSLVDGEAIQCEECGGDTCLTLTLCNECLDEARRSDREAEYDHYPDHLEAKLA